MRTHTLSALLTLALAGCATIDRPAMTKFEPTGTADGARTFKYTARADVIYRHDDPNAEAERMRWLDLYMAENRFCPMGYSIISRDAIAIDVGLATVHDIYYHGRCKT